MRGPNVFAGYWRNPEATAAAFAGRLAAHGDVAERDDEGYYRISGRLKEMYISGGENVYPAEVEDVLHEHPASRTRPSWACRTSAGARSASRSSCCEPGATASDDELLECVPRAARALQGAEPPCVRRRAPTLGDEQGAEGRAARRGGRRHDRDGAPPGLTGARSAAAASGRARSCSRRPSRSSPTLGYHEASIVKITEAAGVARAPSTSTSRARRRSSTSSCSTSTAACATR